MDAAAAKSNTEEKKSKGTNSSKRRRFNGEADDDEAEEEEEQCDMEVWETLRKSFRQVQSVLDQNRALIQQANDNHQSRVQDNLVKNVDLIRQINGNISKVLSIYSDLSVNFSTVVQQRRAIVPGKTDDEKVVKKATTEN